jgi:hypothetical protein
MWCSCLDVDSGWCKESGKCSRARGSHLTLANVMPPVPCRVWRKTKEQNVFLFVLFTEYF